MTASLRPALLATLAVPLVTSFLLTPLLAEAASSEADEARALKVADAKLAALAIEGNGGSAAWSSRKKPARKQQRHLRKKKRKGNALVQAKAEPGSGMKNGSRRLSHADVQAILSTTRDFSGADLSGLTLPGIDFSGARLTRSNLQEANLERANLAESDLELANLTGANLTGASLNQARLRGTNFESARLDGALWIDRTVCKRGSTGRCVE